jgi:hypothetical protein
VKQEFWNLLLELAPVIFIVSIASSFLKGVRRVMEYLKSLIASYLLGIPAALLMEYFFPGDAAWALKYAVVLGCGTFGVCLFNGTFKIIKHFEKDPEGLIDDVMRYGDKNDVK